MRVIAGRFGGRRLTAPSGRGTRPTSERVREALFNILGERVCGARVADLFAGTGAMGLEALSRGASRVDFYEAGKAARRALMDNVRSLGVGAQVRLVSVALPRAITAGEPWDVVILDPPWRKQLAVSTVARLLEVQRLAAGGVIVVEEEAGHQPDAAEWTAMGLTVVDTRRYGDTALALLEHVE